MGLRKDGYVTVWLGGRWQYLHRVVMEANLGRPLEATESVHHRNGDRADNRIDNLELWSRPQPYGQRVEDLVAWVVAQYPNLVRAQLEGGRSGRSGRKSDPSDRSPSAGSSVERDR